MKLSDLFEVNYGQSLSLNKLKQTEPGEGVAFVSRTARNNGVAAWVEPVAGVDPLPAGALTVCLRSRNYALATFVQPRPFYCGYHIYVLTPRREMSLQEKLWWADCIRSNRFRYNFGRQANRSLAGLDIPDSAPSWVEGVQTPALGTLATNNDNPPLSTEEWMPFKLSDLFELHRGRNVLKRKMEPGSTAYVGASADRNGITAWIDEAPDYLGGQITVSSNGSVGEAFYQPKPFIASGDVTVLQPKQPLAAPEALFLCTLIYREKYRWNYGRKWGISRMRESEVRLPVDGVGQPDWALIRRLITSRPLYALVDAGVDA